MPYLEWFEKVYPRLTAAGLWLRGGELNTLPVVEYDLRGLRVLWVRLSTYLDVGASFTHQLLYQIAARTDGVYPDLAYLPPQQDLPLFREAGVPWLLGTQTKRGPLDFDLIGFSVSVVQELLNLPALLRESGIPISKRERLERPEVPLLVLGGASALYSSVAWGPDPWVDAVFVGEDDRAIRELLESCREGKARGQSKREVLTELGRIEGLLEPDRLGTKTRKARTAVLDDAEALQRGPVMLLQERLGRGHLQISEGCPCFCRFCAESWDRKPYRERSPDKLRQLALHLKAAMGLERIDLSSSNFNLYSGLGELLWELIPLFDRIGLKSQRFDLLAHDVELLQLLRILGKTSLSCGLEGISPRLRRTLNKSLSEADLYGSMEAIFRMRPRELKIFLIATGLEEEEDFLALDDLLGRLGRLRGERRDGARVIVSMTPLVRFPWTPLELEDAFSIEHFRPILGRVARSVRRAGLEYREAADLADYWVSQVLVRASKPGIGEALLRALEETQFLYYRRIPDSFQERFAASLERQGLDPKALLLGADPQPASLEEAPWSAVDTGVSREFLRKERLRSRAHEDSDYCLGRSWTVGHCAGCGVCTPSEVREMIRSRPIRRPSLQAFAARHRAAHQAVTGLRFLVEVAPAARGLPRKLLGVALARALMLTRPELVPAYRRFVGAHYDLGGREVWLEGEEVLTLLWDDTARALLEELATDRSAVSLIDGELGGLCTWRGLAPKDWAPYRLVMTSPYPAAPDPYLRSLGLKFTRMRLSEGGYRYALPKESLKKKLLADLLCRPLPSGETETVIWPGPKLRPDEFAQLAFALPDPADWVRIRIRVEGRQNGAQSPAP